MKESGRPYTVLIDTAEQNAFTFEGIRSDAEDDFQPILVTTRRQALGRHPDSLGDYTIDCLFQRCHVERKSISDLVSTVLGYQSGSRRRFEKELWNLSQLESAMVVVEGTFEDCINSDTLQLNYSEHGPKNLLRSVLALTQDFSVPFWFARNRRAAEVATFRFLDRFYHNYHRRVLYRGKRRSNANRK